MATTYQLVATPRDAAAVAVPGQTISWISNTPRIATVNSTGLVQSVSSGVAKIIASCQGRFAESDVTVTGTPVASSAGAMPGYLLPGPYNLDDTDSDHMTVYRGTTGHLRVAAIRIDSAGGTGYVPHTVRLEIEGLPMGVTATFPITDTVTLGAFDGAQPVYVDLVCAPYAPLVTSYAGWSMVFRDVSNPSTSYVTLPGSSFPLTVATAP